MFTVELEILESLLAMDLFILLTGQFVAGLDANLRHVRDKKYESTNFKQHAIADLTI